MIQGNFLYPDKEKSRMGKQVAYPTGGGGTTPQSDGFQ